MSEFRAYDHLERYGVDEVEGIDMGIVHVFPKLDGTNARVALDASSGGLICGSRRRVVTPDDDNAGFASWALSEAQTALVSFIESIADATLLDPGEVTVYGEWLVPHTLKTYREEAWRRFWIFDVHAGHRYLPHARYSDLAEKVGIDLIAPLCLIENPTEEQLRRVVESNTYLIQDGCGSGEGIVLKNYAWQNKYGRQPWAKVVRNEFKEKNRGAFGVPRIAGAKVVEQEIAREFVTPSLVAKERAKIEQETTDRAHLIPRLLGTVFHCVVSEDMWHAVKKHKNPTIDFKRLNAYCTLFVKEYAADLFGGLPYHESV